MRSEIIRELNTEYDRLREKNAMEEQARQAYAAQLCPEIAALQQEQEQLIFGSIRGILAGQQSNADIPTQMQLLTNRIHVLLKKHGLPDDYLDPIYRCKTCRDTGYTGEPVKEMCDCFRGQFFARLYQRMGLTSTQEQSFERFDATIFPDTPAAGYSFSQRDVMQMYCKRCQDWADQYPKVPQKTMVMMGQSGLGKTYLMHCIAKRLLQRGVHVLMISAYAFLDTARKAYFSGKAEDLNTLMEADVLLIDDMGSEPLMENITITQWFNLINERQNHGRGTIITTNLKENELRERYTERIASRILNNDAMILHFIGDDVRRRNG